MSDDGRGSAKAQRLRLRFTRGSEAATLGQLDMARTWERACHEAEIAVSFSESKRPQPRLTLAPGLPSGATSEGELLDAILARPLRPEEVCRRLNACLPEGLRVLDAHEVGMGLPSLPSALRWADYEVCVPVGDDGAPLRAAIAGFLAMEQLPWEDTRGEKVRRYDLRPLVRELRLEAMDTATGEGAGQRMARLRMRLRCGPGGTGRPEQVVKALGMAAPASIHRLRLILAELSPARDAWRRRGRFVA